MIVIELAELLGEWWFFSIHEPQPSRSIEYPDTVRGVIEAGGQMKCPRTGVGVYECNSAVRVAPFRSTW